MDLNTVGVLITDKYSIKKIEKSEREIAKSVEPADRLSKSKFVLKNQLRFMSPHRSTSKDSGKRNMVSNLLPSSTPMAVQTYSTVNKEIA